MIAKNKDSYVNIAKNLASHGPRKIQRRSELRKKMENSALADGARLSVELEKTYKFLREKSATADLRPNHLSEGFFQMIHKI